MFRVVKSLFSKRYSRFRPSCGTASHRRRGVVPHIVGDVGPTSMNSPVGGREELIPNLLSNLKSDPEGIAKPFILTNFNIGGVVTPLACIPVIHLDRPEEVVAKEIDIANQTVGFFHVVNHGVPAELQEAMFAKTKEFFAQSSKMKKTVAMNENSPSRGYFAYEQEDLNFEESIADYKGDLKEGFDMGYDSLESQKFFGERQFPEFVPEFQETAEAYMVAMRAYCGKLMRIFALGLGLPPTYFDPHLTDPLSTLRLLHYKTQSNNFDRQLGCAAHTDYGTCTALLQDEVGGLQVRCNGEWIDVTPIKGSYVTNLGDMLQYWSGGRWKSTVHKVVNVSGKDRYSIPFFYNPNADTPIVPLTGVEHACGGTHMTCADHLVSRYKKSKLV